MKKLYFTGDDSGYHWFGFEDGVTQNLTVFELEDDDIMLLGPEGEPLGKEKRKIGFI